MTPAELRRQVFERDGNACRWPSCSYSNSQINPLECAHLIHRGMGGSMEANRLDNAVCLCKAHHDVLDSRQGRLKARVEVAELLKAAVGI